MISLKLRQLDPIKRPRSKQLSHNIRKFKNLMTEITKSSALLASESIDIESVKTVCLALGPYRNLTTVTASILFLHPHCQVLNHAGQRIFGEEELDFIKDYSDGRFKTFLRYAIYISQSGIRGDFGGSITRSHAFDKHHKVHDLFTVSKLPLVKEKITTVFWKESLRTANYIRENNVDLNKLFTQNKQLRFLLPIRNPLDCAIGQVKTGYIKYFQGRKQGDSVEQAIDSILDEFLWFLDLMSRNPDRFFYFFEHDFNEPTIKRIADFLQLEMTEIWLNDAITAFEIKSDYNHPDVLIAYFRKSVGDKFSDYPDFAEQLLLFS